MTQPWPTAQLSEVGSVIRGVSFKQGEAGNRGGEGLIPILRAGNIKEDLDTENEVVWVPGHRVSHDQILRLGDVVVAMSSGSPHVVGKTAQLRRPWHGSAGAFCAIVRFNDPSIVSRFGALWLRSSEFAAWRLARGEGANIQNIRKSDLEAVEIPVPPLAAQQRIVKLLDAAEELRRMRAEADRRTADLIPAIFYEMFGDPTTNAKNWRVLDLGELIVDGPQNGLYKHSSTYGHGTPILRINSFYEGRVTSIEELQRLQLSNEEVEKYSLRENDIVINRVNSPAYLGKSALIPPLLEPTVFESNMMRFAIDADLVDPIFTINYLQTSAIKSQIQAKEKHAIHQSSINQQDVLALKLAVPPLPLQRQFAARVTEVRALEAQQAASRRRLDDLFQSMLHRAFRGEL